MPLPFTFTTGVDERHEITVNMAGIQNRVTVAVDGTVMVDSGGNLGNIMPNVFDLEVGTNERHMVSVRFIDQYLIDGGARYIDVFVDGKFAFRADW